MTSLASPGSMVVVPRRSRLPCFDLLISRWRLWPQLRTILPVPVRPKRFFAPLFVLSLGIPISVSGTRRRGISSQCRLPPIRAALYSDAAFGKQVAAVTATGGSCDQLQEQAGSRDALVDRHRHSRGRFGGNQSERHFPVLRPRSFNGCAPRL